MAFIKINNKIINLNNIIKFEYDETLDKYVICLSGESPILISVKLYNKLEQYYIDVIELKE